MFPSVLLGLLLAYNLTAYMPPDVAFYSRFDCQSPKIRDAASQAHIHHALVFVHQTGNYYYCPYSSVFDNNDLSFNGDVVYARDLGPSDRKLIALYPGRAVYRLRGSHLSPMPTALTAGQTGATPARVWARPTGVGGAGRGV